MKPKINHSVLHLIDTTGPGGAETVFLDIAEGMQHRGWTSHVVLVGPGWVATEAAARGLSFEVIPTYGRFDVSFARRLLQAVKSKGAEAIHAHLFSPAVYASAVSLFCRVPVIATFHGSSDLRSNGIGALLRNRMISRRAHLVCVSNAMLKQAKVTPGIETATVIHNGVDHRRFNSGDRQAVRSEMGVPDDTILIGAIGNLRPAKDYATFLHAARNLADESRLRFAVVGDTETPLYEELTALRDKLGLAERLRFWGFRTDIPSVLSALDVLVISSSNEGFSLVAVQAMAAGTAVVSTRCGGPEEIIEDGVSGVLVPVGDADALSRAIRAVATSDDLRKTLAAGGLQRVLERFSLSSMLDSYEELYRRVLTT
jgi:glycosyltransferase involved in cell wall biosynthesis